MRSLYPRKESSFREKHFISLFFLSAIVVIAILFILAIAITSQAYYVQLGGV